MDQLRFLRRFSSSSTVAREMRIQRKPVLAKGEARVGEFTGGVYPGLGLYEHTCLPVLQPRSSLQALVSHFAHIQTPGNGVA